MVKTQAGFVLYLVPARVWYGLWWNEVLVLETQFYRDSYYQGGMFRKLLVCWASAVTPKVTLNYSVTLTLKNDTQPGERQCGMQQWKFPFLPAWHLEPHQEQVERNWWSISLGLCLSFIYPIPVSSLGNQILGYKADKPHLCLVLIWGIRVVLDKTVASVAGVEQGVRGG